MSHDPDFAKQQSKHISNFFKTSHSLDKQGHASHQVGNIINVHPQRVRGRRTDYASGNKGTAVVTQTQEHEPFSAITVSDGLLRKKQPNYHPELEKDTHHALLTLYLTSNPLGGQVINIGDAKFSRSLEWMALRSWKFTTDLQDTSTTATPTGPVLLRISGDKFGAFEHLLDNFPRGGNPSEFLPLLFNLNSNETFTQMPHGVPEKMIVKRWRDGDGHVRDIRIELFAPDGVSRVDFTAATLQFELKPSQWG